MSKSVERIWMGIGMVWILGSFSLHASESSVSRVSATPTKTITFENVRAGTLPPSWKSEATNGGGKRPVWIVTETKEAPSGKKVLRMRTPARPYGSAFNLCWTKKIRFQNGSIDVRFKARKGVVDRGGGIAWRIRDRNNYYVARFNPLEDNFRLYYVENGRRSMLTGTHISLPSETWHHMRIEQTGNTIVCYLDGKPLLRTTDHHFEKAGGVGLWTKADAVTDFDDLIVHPEE
ncbi:family 16 glycoside hydrolase [Hydrogenimonas sp.]